MIMTQVILVDGIEVKIERKPIKNMYLRVKPNGDVMVSAHPKMELNLIEQFLRTKRSWIHQKRQHAMSRDYLTVTESEVRYLGKTLKKQRLAASKINILIQADVIRMELPPRLTPTKAEALLQEWLLEQLDKTIRYYMKRYWPYFAANGIRPVEVKYRQMTSTWGVCRPIRGTITFNKRLIHERVEFIEYVVVHELCHLVHPDHSPRFYHLLEQLMPNWRRFQRPF